jgi:methyl-accepting chemotaxis protein/NO-binding membrane sensor protein with MHYT domain
MFRVIGCIVEQHDLLLVVLAAVLCVFASATALSMLARGRASTAAAIRMRWAIAAAVVAACGIWGTHFVAMLAFQPGMPVAYEPILTFVSILVAAGFSAVGFFVALSRFGAALGGLITGAAISAMHFVGMAAVEMPARADWDVSYVVAAVAIGIAMTALTLHVALRSNDMRSYLLGVALFVVAIVGMHFTAMTAVTYTPDAAVAVPETVLAPAILAIAVAAVSAMIVALGLIGSLIDRHLAGRASDEAARLREHIAQLEATKAELETTSSQLKIALSTADIVTQANASSSAAQADVVELLAGGLENLAQGHISFRIVNTFPGGYRKLSDDFNVAMEKLQDALQLVRHSVYNIRANTSEIAHAAEDLSRRTEKQAASIEETSGALSDITATVRKTADGAEQARKVVAAAKSDAEQSGAVAREAVTAMREIEQSARQITQIVGLIDEIAFQTNLLALNAGVEAARAGDSGRGFAVVAAEVRALAQRSAGAAKEIKALIQTSTDQVGTGVALVGQMGEALTRILSHIGDINTRVGQFAADAAEQATGLVQVNVAVEEMDRATQKNAAMVEETTATGMALARDAEDLAELINRFDIGATGVAKPEPARPVRRAQKRR